VFILSYKIRNRVIFFGLSFLALCSCLDAAAITGGPAEYGAEVISDAGRKIKDLLNGPVRGIIAVCGAFLGILRSVQTQTLGPLMAFGGIGVAAVVLPQIVDKVFAALI